MALLRSNARTRWLLGGLAVLGLGGCMIMDSLLGREKRLAFSHRIHVSELDCTDCHVGAEDEPVAGIPTLAQCKLCHDDDQQAEWAPDRRIANLFEDGKYKATRVNALGDEVIFPHPDHASIAPDCATCHKGIEENDDVATLEPVTMDACISCHQSLNQPTDCATCHSRISQESPPDTHHQNWTKAHGHVVRSGDESTAQRCDLCHEKSSCDQCHLIEPPQNHTNFWRRRGHAVVSRMDRNSCASCHRTDFCDRCHAQALPMNHAGMWGSPRDNHCLTCHFPLKSEGCISCHKDTPSHLGATPIPPGHSLSLNCRQCHGLSAPLPHVDKGDECILCHR